MAGLITETKEFKEFAQKAKEGKTFHGYIAESDDPLYCDAFLTEVFKYLMCDRQGCGECSVCYKVRNKMHLDVLYYPRGTGETISVTEDMNDFAEQVALRPYEGGNRIFVFNVGKTVRIDWQNKLLKTLEEPPENTYIFIAVSNAEKLLATIKSRCANFPIGTPSYEYIKEYLKATGTDNRRAGVSEMLAGRNLTLAMKYATDEKYMDMADDVYEFLVGCKSSREICKYLGRMSVYKDIIGETADVFIAVFCRALTGRRAGTAEAYRQNDLDEIYKAYKTTGCTEGIFLAAEIKRMNESNVNKNALLDELFLRLMEVRYKCRLLSE